MNKQLTAWEQFWYVLSVIATLGGVFTMKVLVKKAILESWK